MVKQFLKSKSKRQSCAKRYKIEKKVREHARKLKKDKIRHPERYRKRFADPGVPNSLPFKDQILAEAAATKLLQDEAREKRREEIKMRRRLARDNIINGKRNDGIDANSIMKDAEKRSAEYERKQEENKINESNDKLTDTSAKAYYKEFKKVVEAADVVLEVLDARDPIGTRCPQMESVVTSQAGKRLVLVLNKADLVPRDNLEKWLKHLRREHPTVVFKSSTQCQNNNISQSSVNILKVDSINSSRCLGADVLLQLLKNYCRNKGIKTAIAVGVVGLPNVGKSSLINSLKRSKACGVGATPGFTKNLQEVQLDSKLRLIDCPGIILPGGDLSDGVAALRNAVRIDSLDDPVKPVEAIFARASHSQLMLHYRVAEFKDSNEFLVLLAKRFGKLKKGGIPDIEVAARTVLHDWNIGKIKYYTEPPIVQDTQIDAKIITEFSKEFSLDSLFDDENKDISALPTVRPSDTMCIQSAGPLTEIKESMETDEEEESDSDIDVDEEEEDQMPANKLLSKSVQIAMNSKSEQMESEEPNTEGRKPIQEYDPTKMSIKKYQKFVAKKTRKERTRNVGRTESLVTAFESFGGINTEKENDTYDFKDYFECKK